MSLTRRLRRFRAPGEDEAGARAWEVVSRAYQEREPVQRTRSPLRPLAAATAGAAAVALLVSPAGAALADWIEDVVDRDDRAAGPAPLSLPAEGRLLVNTATGPWIVNRDGSKRLLGDYSGASWSPGGLFVVAHKGRDLSAVEPRGRVRWSLTAREPVAGARWAPSGFRIAYLSGSALRVVAGDGSGDRRLTPRAAARVAPAWRPGSAHVLAYADTYGRVTAVDADTGRMLWRSGRGEPPLQIEWSADGTRVVALDARMLRVFDGAGVRLQRLRLRRLSPLPSRGAAGLVAFGPSGHRFALVRQAARGSREVVLLDAGADPEPVRRLFAGPGGVGDLAWSPDGRWILIGWDAADQWLFVAPDGSRPVRAADRMSERFDPGEPDGAQLPGRTEWCC